MLLKSKEAKAKGIAAKGILAGIIEAAYIVLACLFVLSAGAIFPAGSPFVILGLVAVAILLVISVAISGLVVFAVPLYLFFQKKYHEALSYLAATLLTLLAIFLIFTLLSLMF